MAELRPESRMKQSLRARPHSAYALSSTPAGKSPAAWAWNRHQGGKPQANMIQSLADLLRVRGRALCTTRVERPEGARGRACSGWVSLQLDGGWLGAGATLAALHVILPGRWPLLKT